MYSYFIYLGVVGVAHCKNILYLVFRRTPQRKKVPNMVFESNIRGPHHPINEL